MIFYSQNKRKKDRIPGYFLIHKWGKNYRKAETIVKYYLNSKEMIEIKR